MPLEYFRRWRLAGLEWFCKQSHIQSSLSSPQQTSIDFPIDMPENLPIILIRGGAPPVPQPPRLPCGKFLAPSLIFITTILLLLSLLTIFPSQNLREESHTFGPFHSIYNFNFFVEKHPTISDQSLQITTDTLSDSSDFLNRSGRIMYNHPFKLWEGNTKSTAPNTIVSFQSSFLINVFRPQNWTASEGLAFLIAPSIQTPIGSEGRWLGLTNSTLNGNPSNQFIAIELDTMKEDFDINDNHIGLDINRIESDTAYNLSKMGIRTAPEVPTNYTIWVEYCGLTTVLNVYIAEEGAPKPANSVINKTINLKEILNQQSYFGFAASTYDDLYCVLEWNLTVEILPKHKYSKMLIPVLAIGIPVIAGFVVWRHFMNKRKMKKTVKNLLGTPREFTYKALKKATNNFDERLKLGEGGFGIVYKGTLPKEGIVVAVKLFSRDKMKGIDDFLDELSIINRIHHRNLVRLEGWCHNNGRVLLVYEYMSNGSLDNHLFGRGPENPLSWDQRYNIIKGLACGLQYLHEECELVVVHRDIKASNVLLDSNFNARLGDLGLARALDNKTTSYAELYEFPGTLGYIAPECFQTGEFTRESDVHGFGAVVLEVVCGRRPICNIAGYEFLVDWVWSLYPEGRILEAVDQRIGQAFDEKQAERLLELGLACSHPIPSERPSTQAIIQVLLGSLATPYFPPIKPAFEWPRQLGSSNYDVSSLAPSDTTPLAIVVRTPQHPGYLQAGIQVQLPTVVEQQRPYGRPHYLQRIKFYAFSMWARYGCRR